jgi:hypothetical protein
MYLCNRFSFNARIGDAKTGVQFFCKVEFLYFSAIVEKILRKEGVKRR